MAAELPAVRAVQKASSKPVVFQSDSPLYGYFRDEISRLRATRLGSEGSCQQVMAESIGTPLWSPSAQLRSSDRQTCSRHSRSSAAERFSPPYPSAIRARLS